MNYIKVSEAAEKWGISARRARILCAEGKVEGVIRKGKLLNNVLGYSQIVKVSNIEQTPER